VSPGPATSGPCGCAMGSTLSSPVELIRVQRHGSAAFRCAVAEMQGMRVHHEDAHSVRVGSSFADFWVLDGHGGDAAAHFGAGALGKEFSAMESPQQPYGCCQPSGAACSRLPTDETAVSTFRRVDEQLRAHIVANPAKASGSTVVGVVAAKGRDGAYALKLLNCGDSRGVLVRGPQEKQEDDLGAAVRLPQRQQADLGKGAESGGPAPRWPVIVASDDHKPDRPDERYRIEQAGGYVSPDTPPRLDGDLAVSRGLGDFEHKASNILSPLKQKVSCEPEIYEVSGLRPGTLCILACDGVWDVFASEQVASFVRSRLSDKPGADLGDIAAELVRESLHRGSMDNVTAMIVHLVDGRSWEDGMPDELKFFDKLRSLEILDDDVKNQYLKFLQRVDFPREPAECTVCGRWFASMQQCPCKGPLYCSTACQREGWQQHRPECTWVKEGIESSEMPVLVPAT